MQRIRKWFNVMALTSIAIAGSTSLGHAQTLTVALSAHAVNFALVGGSATNLGNTTISATTSWKGIGGGGRTLTVYAYFANAATALTGPANIPSSAMSISVNGTAFRAMTFTEVFGGANAGRHVVLDIPINGTGTRTDSIIFNLDLSTGTLPLLPPGTYTGTISIQAQAI
jgi:hypothetical protein